MVWSFYDIHMLQFSWEFLKSGFSMVVTLEKKMNRKWFTVFCFTVNWLQPGDSGCQQDFLLSENKISWEHFEVFARSIFEVFDRRSFENVKSKFFKIIILWDNRWNQGTMQQDVCIVAFLSDTFYQYDVK